MVDAVRKTRAGNGSRPPAKVAASAPAAQGTPVTRGPVVAPPTGGIPDRFPRRVRTTFRPDQIVDIDRAGYVDLYRAGLIIEDLDAGPYDGIVPAALHPRSTRSTTTEQEEMQ